MRNRSLQHLYPVEYRTCLGEIMPGTKRYIHRWQPLGSRPVGLVTLVHGLGDHGARFNAMANSLASQGFGVLAVDLVGHGRSPGRRGVISSYEQLLDEVGNSVYLTDRTWGGGLPLYVYGQSMGGNLVLNWSMRRPFEAKSLSGVVAAAPMLRMVRPPSQQFLTAGRWLEKWIPNYRLTSPVDVRQLCSDRSGQDAYLKDRCVHRKLSIRLGNALLESGAWVIDHSDLLLKPVLLMHGCEDTLTCPNATQELASRSGPNVSLKLWPHCRHDLHHELQRESIVAHVLAWAAQQAKKSGSHRLSAAA
jgi:alpha-beta hydrolase superfamily lysophospholipase